MTLQPCSIVDVLLQTTVTPSCLVEPYFWLTLDVRLHSCCSFDTVLSLRMASRLSTGCAGTCRSGFLPRAMYMRAASSAFLRLAYCAFASSSALALSSCSSVSQKPAPTCACSCLCSAFHHVIKTSLLLQSVKTFQMKSRAIVQY